MIRFTKSPRKFGGTPLTIRARKFRTARPGLPPILPDPGLNIPETRVEHALNELHIAHQTQSSILGGDVLGGGRADWLLNDYMIDLEYAGPFHKVSQGAARDVLRNLGFQRLGYRVVTLGESDLYRLKPRLLEIIGKRL